MFDNAGFIILLIGAVWITFNGVKSVYGFIDEWKGTKKL